MSNLSPGSKKIIAFVGMPGAGKSIAAKYLKEKNYPVVRFGDITDEKLSKLKLEMTPKNEEKVREQLRQELGMEAYAVLSASKIKSALEKSYIVVIDGLYSWEEYLYLKREFPSLFVVHIFAEPSKRYERLLNRSVRPFTYEEAKSRDIREIERLSKGGPIAMADYLIDNDKEKANLSAKIEELLEKIKI